ncbi:unnamed protein product [Ceutorhynchus assimilis]|uniref:Luciferin 4-monooxygenase n=1 Tax=Ceutorhynchus assimilis TaxID=467358 RepID=A0A9N9MIL3_9CUCU|nr:unnamed protein product [Ceutorhynchus assimilis]
MAKTNDFILRGPPCHAPKIDKGVGEYFFEQADKLGDTIFQIDGNSGKTETYGEVKRRSTRVALYLQKIGLKSKDIVLLCCKNNLDNIVPALAAQYLGAIVASIDPTQSVADAKHAITLVEPKVIFFEEKSLDLLNDVLQEFDQKPHMISIGSLTGKCPDMSKIETEGQGEQNFEPIKQKGSDVAVILFSSGTTSAPKGIYLTNWGMLNVVGSVIQHNNLKTGMMMHFTSLYWVSAWLTTSICIVTGTSKVIGTDIDTEKILEIIEKYKVTHIFTSNLLIYRLTNLPVETFEKFDTSSLYSMLTGGSTIDPQQLLAVRKCLPHTYVNLAYGSSEGSFLVCYNYSDRKLSDEKISSSGMVVPGVQLKFSDVDTRKPLGPNQTGEICIKSEYMMGGYHKFSNPNVFDEDGFLKTGDVGYYDEDGYVYVTDRIGEMFKYQSYQISPTVLETALLQHPAVGEAVAFGLSDPVNRNLPAACVVLKFNASEQELKKFIESKLGDRYQLRGGIKFVEKIPRTPSGKYQRRGAKELFLKLQN